MPRAIGTGNRFTTILKVYCATTPGMFCKGRRKRPELSSLPYFPSPPLTTWCSMILMFHWHLTPVFSSTLHDGDGVTTSDPTATATTFKDSIVMFICAISLVENIALLPSYFFFFCGWTLTDLLILHSSDPRLSTFWIMISLILTWIR